MKSATPRRKSGPSRQYTIRNVPDHVDRVLRQRAQASHVSFNQVALEALIAGVGEAIPRRDLTRIAGSMPAEEADALEEEIRRQHRVDPELWT